MSNAIRLRRADVPLTGAPLKRVHGSLFSLSVFPLAQERSTSFACFVSKKVAPKAVQRNLVKRRCREAVRARMRTFPLRLPLALVFQAKKGVASASFAEIARDIEHLIDRIS